MKCKDVQVVGGYDEISPCISVIFSVRSLD